MNAAAVDPVQVEQTLRRHVRQARGLRAMHYRSLSGRETFWPDAAALAVVEARDEIGECMRVAAETAQRHGFELVVGWTLDFEGACHWHCANLSPTGELVDAGRARHRPGMVGKIATEREAAMLTRAAGQRTAGELADRGSSLLSALLG